ncbi:MAG: M48 family metallopeptidase [Betaproteobacteria bacterium]
MPRRSLRQLDLPLEFRRDDGAHAHIAFGSTLVPYTVKRSRRRGGSYTLAIDERGLRIGVSGQASPRWIEGILRKHEGWILRKLSEWRARRVEPVRWEHGAALMFLGELLCLTSVPGEPCPRRDGNRLLVPSPADGGTAQAVIAWLREQALACFKSRIEHYAPRLCVAVRDVRLSEARTRWGSCSPAGKIMLNWRLIQVPLRLLDYVVVHELAHLKEMNHSPGFWRVVAEAIPDYAARRKEMRGDAHRYLVL